MSHLGKFFRTRRIEKGLSLRQAATLAGYKNLNKGTNRIQKFEAGGKIAPDLFAKLVSILEVTRRGGPSFVGRGLPRMAFVGGRANPTLRREKTNGVCLSAASTARRRPLDRGGEGLCSQIGSGGSRKWSGWCSHVGVRSDSMPLARKTYQLEATPEIPCCAIRSSSEASESISTSPGATSYARSTNQGADSRG